MVFWVFECYVECYQVWEAEIPDLHVFVTVLHKNVRDVPQLSV